MACPLPPHRVCCKSRSHPHACLHPCRAFLPDKEREAELARLRETLKAEFHAAQEATKKEKLEITYSYWDGTGHRRSITVPKGTTIRTFLEWVRQDLMADFPEMRNVSGDQLVYVKEDLIIPQTYSFYDLIATKARGKSGPLFHFDVHDDVRAGVVSKRLLPQTTPLPPLCTRIAHTPLPCL